MGVLTRFLVILTILLGTSMGEVQANSSAILTITPITWNIIGLDSNNVNVGPNTFPVGARVCNTGSESASNLEAKFYWDSANALINIRPGSLNSIPHESLAPGGCVDFYFEVELTRNASAYSTTRRFHIEVSADDLAVISTPTPREIYVERLISQNRNATLDVKLDGVSIAPGGNMTLMVGQTYNITLIAKTATQGYEQIESFINFPNTIFQILNVETIYSADTSDNVDNPSDLLYGDGCIWQNDPNSPTYRSCLSTGKVGGNISVNYTVKIIGGSGTSNILNTLVYDFSGASYHYNSDYSTSSRVASIVSANLSKTFVPKTIQPGGTASLVFKITNPSTSLLTDLNFNDELPEGLSVSSSTINYTGCGSPSPSSLGVGSSMLSFSNISVTGLGTCTITVSVTATTEKLYTNTTSSLFIGDEDTGDTGTDTLLVASTGACLPGQQLVTWTFPTGSSATTPLFTTKSSNVTTALASTTTTTPAIEANTGNPAPSWSGQGFSSGAYFQFQVDTSRYTDVKIYFDHITTTQNWNTTAAVTLLSSTNGTTFTANTLSSGSSLLDATFKRATFNTTVGSTYFRISASGAQNNNARMAIDNVTLTGCLEPAPAPTITKSFSPDPIKLGSTSTLTFTIRNTASGNVAQTGISFTDILPDGLNVLNATTSACNDTNNLVTSSSNQSITLTGGSLAAGATCTFQVPVIGEKQGLHENISGFLSSDQSGTTTSYATDTLIVIAPPKIIKTFGSTAILVGESTSLTFTISNPNTSTTLTGISFTDTLPAGVEIEKASSSVCNGTLTSTDNYPSQDTINLSGASLLPVTSCTFTVMVSGSTVGLKENSVTVSSTEGGTGNTDQAIVLVKAPTPALTFLKQVGSSTAGPWSSFLSVNIADPVFYRFVIENTGDVLLTGITLSDPEIDTSGCLWMDGDGIPFVDDDPSSLAFSFSLPIADDDEGHLAYCVLDPDLSAEAGSHTNTASADSLETNPVTSSATYATPEITLSKSAQESFYSAEGEILHYSYLVENTGSVPLLGPVEISDDKTTVTCPAVTTVGDLDNYLDPGESLTCSAVYSVKAEDITAGSVTNTAVASIAGSSSQEDSVTVSYRSPADLQIQKTNSTANIGLVGTSFTWTITISNQGGSDASFAEGTTILSDTLPAGATYGTPSVSNINNVIGFTNISCQVAANVLTCISEDGAVVIGATTGSFDVNIHVSPETGGNLVNTATVDPDNAIPEMDETNNSATNTVFIADPGISISKKVSTDESTWMDSVTVNVGDTVYFQISVENAGNIPLSGVLVNDDQCTLTGPSGDTNTDGLLDTDETWTYTCSDTAAAGTNTNTATVDSDQTDESTDTAEYFGNDPDISISKKVSTDESTWMDSVTVNVGDTVYFQIIIMNTGNVPLSGVVVNDDQCTLTGPSGDTNSDSLLDTDETWTYTCSDTAAAGTNTNTATVDSDQTTESTDGAEYFGNDPGISISKKVSTDESTWMDSATVNVGDTVYFQISVENAGNIPLSGVLVNDDQCTLTGPSGDTNSDSLLDTDETWTYTCSVTAAAGTNTNTATVDSDQTTESTDGAEYFGNDPGISISKKVSRDNSTWLDSVTVNVGDTVYFQIIVMNTGNVPLSGVLVNDNQCTLTGPSGDTNSDSLLDTDETWTYTCSVTAAAGTNTNTATVDSDQTDESTDTAEYIGNDPQLSLEKFGTLDLTVIPPVNEVNPGDKIYYSYILTNTGNFALQGPFTVEDDKATVTCPETPTSLQPVDTMTCSATYTITQSDIENGSVTNIATANNGTIYSNDDTVTINLLQQPLLGLAKYVVGGPINIGVGTWEVTFEILVQNYGNVSLFKLQVEDNLQTTFPNPSTFKVIDLSSDKFDVNWPGFDGAADKNLLTGTDQLDPDASGIITLVLEIVPANDGPFLNSAFGSAETGNGDPASDYSQRGTSPDPDQDGDPTNNNLPTPVEFGWNLYNPPAGAKTVDTSQYPLLLWQITWVNNTNLVGIQVTSSDPIPAGTAFFNNLISSGYPLPGGDLPAGSVNTGVKCHTTGSTITQHCYYEGPTNQYPRGRVIWQGIIAPDPADVILQNAQNAIKIDFSVSVSSGVTSVINTATVDVDLNGDGDSEDIGEQSTIIVSSDWQSIPLPEALPVTGFRPGAITTLASKPLNLVYSQKNLTLEIPELGLSNAIVGVPLSNQGWQTDWLFSQIGYLEGTAFPTWNGNTVLTAHVYDANGLPGPFVNLSKLGWGDQLVIHAWGQKYVYEVRTVDQRVNPADTSYLQHEEKDWLTLITCQGYDQELNAYRWRVVVRAVLVKID